MRRCVKDDIRPVTGKHRLQPPFIPYRTDQHRHVKPREFPFQRFLDLVCIVFINIKNDQMTDTVAS